MVTKLQNQINHFIGVKSENNATVHRSKQALYDKMFNANNFSTYVPTGNESKFELLVKFNIHVAIARYRLKRIGNMNALELLNNINHTVSLEDLQQEVLLKFVELENEWTIGIDGKVEFLTDISIVEIFKAIDNYLYRFQTKHYKHLYIEIDNDIVDCNKVTQLADYVSIDNLLQDLNLQMFKNRLSIFDNQWLELRFAGHSNSNIARILNVTYEKVRACETRVRKSWQKWNIND